MDMPVLNDDPNSHDPLRPLPKSSTPTAMSKSAFSPSSSTRLDSKRLSISGLLHTVQAVSEFKSYTHAPTLDGARTEPKLDLNVTTSRRNTLAGLQQ